MKNQENLDYFQELRRDAFLLAAAGITFIWALTAFQNLLIGIIFFQEYNNSMAFLIEAHEEIAPRSPIDQKKIVLLSEEA